MAWEKGLFKDESMVVETTVLDGAKSRKVTVDKDECVRPDTSLDALGKLKPVFDPTGTVTAGNSSPITDGAAAVVVTTMERAKALGIPPGPIYAELKAGRDISLEDGRIINGASLCGPDRPGASVVYCTDTVFCEAAVELARGADLLIHESTFSHAEAELAYQRQHSTSTMAAQTALEAGVKQLVLTHLSPRYMPGNPMTPDDLVAEAQSIFANTLVAKDFLSIDITPSEPATA